MNMLALTKAADCLKYRVVLGMDTLIIAHIEVYLLGIVREFQMYVNFIFKIFALCRHRQTGIFPIWNLLIYGAKLYPSLK